MELDQNMLTLIALGVVIYFLSTISNKLSELNDRNK